MVNPRWEEFTKGWQCQSCGNVWPDKLTASKCCSCTVCGGELTTYLEKQFGFHKECKPEEVKK